MKNIFTNNCLEKFNSNTNRNATEKIQNNVLERVDKIKNDTRKEFE